MRAEALGFAFRFLARNADVADGLAAAKCLLETLRRMAFTGRCEFYHKDDLVYPAYVVGLGLAYPDGPPFVPDKPWWDAFVANLNDLCTADGRIYIVMHNCEFMRVRAMRLTLLGRGAIAFEKGVPKAVLAADEGSLFQLVATEAMEARTRASRGRIHRARRA
jgi:hypothetical protein